jgi:uncharacterized protein (UPF0261 family)
MTKAVALLGAFDTKGQEYGYLADLLREHDLGVVLIDTSIIGKPTIASDIPSAQVAERGGSSLTRLRADADRAVALDVMAAGAAATLERLYDEGRIHGVMALGGTGGTSVASRAVRGLPLGVPKLIISTAASGDTATYVGESDLILIPSVTDIAGLNRLLRRVITNAAAAMAGMLGRSMSAETPKRSIGASMFGVTTPCVQEARRLLEARDLETLVFHMTGTGGRTLEHLVRAGWIDGVLDVTTTELADELVGGVFDAGPTRMTGAAERGIPQVVSVGALDMVNFGPMESIPARFAGRRFHRHNASVTLMRTTAVESAELGRRLAERISASQGPAAVFLPLRGISSLATADGAFFDPEADAALFRSIRSHLGTSKVELVEIDTDINDPQFAAAMVGKLLSYVL